MRHGARLGALSVVLALALGAPAPASARGETLKRSVSNILMAPLDLGLSPVVGARSVYQNLREVDDSLGVRVFFAVPGVAWNTGIQIFAAVIRETAGLLELLPGIGLYVYENFATREPRETPQLSPLFVPAERGEALVDVDTPLMRFKFGIEYTRVPF